MSMDLNAILSGVTVGAITFSGVLRALFLLLIGLIGLMLTRMDDERRGGMNRDDADH